MSLSELMSSMDLAVYPQVAMVIFLCVFGAVTWRTFTRRGAEECRRMATLPLEECPARRGSARGCAAAPGSDRDPGPGRAVRR